MNSKAPITFNLNLDKVDIDNLLLGIQAQPQNAPTPKMSKSAAPTKTANNSSTNARTISGDLNIAELKSKNIVLTNVKSSLKLENNLLKLSNLTAKLYQGSLSAQVTKDL